MDIYTYIDAAGLTTGPELLGVLRAEMVRGREVFSFNFDPSLLAGKNLPYLDPDIQPYDGQQWAPEGKENFGIFLDSCPDRWGRVLMQRRELLRARDEGRDVGKLCPSDYLLGVFDGNRMGALRFKTDPEGPFLDADARLAAPPITSLRALEQASLSYERTNAVDGPAYRQWLRMLYQPGSSLGGARPKANVTDAQGNLWIAKFPSHHDAVDVGAWEYIATRMAREFGISVAQVDAKRFGSPFHTFLSRRFDRDEHHRRHYFASAMTLLGYTDGDDAQAGVSYLELADFLQQYGVPELVQADLAELWKRIVLNIAITNCDDHLRNHGFLLTRKGWKLSPAFDLTPNPDGMGLKLNICEDDNSLSYELAIEMAPFFGLSKDEAHQLVTECTDIVTGWRGISDRLGISRAEQEMMAPAFRVQK